MSALILRLDISGRPVGWVSPEDGALLYCRDQVVWEAGGESVRLHGGVSRSTGSRSMLDVNSIVATRSVTRESAEANQIPVLTNATLFRRDSNLCLYCGKEFPSRMLSRDHVLPRKLNGADEWNNVVTSCKRCNHFKADNLLEDINMELIALPYTPNRAEVLILANRHILSCQMEFLRGQVGKDSRLLA